MWASVSNALRGSPHELIAAASASSNLAADAQRLFVQLQPPPGVFQCRKWARPLVTVYDAPRHDDADRENSPIVGLAHPWRCKACFSAAAVASCRAATNSGRVNSGPARHGYERLSPGRARLC